MTTIATPTRRHRAASPVAVVGVFVCLVVGVIGGVLVAQSLKDYTSYTASTLATVTDVVVEHHSGTRRHTGSTSRDYYVDYEADGETFTAEPLEGVVHGRLQEGDTLTLVYPPGSPEDAVTEATTTATTAHVLRAIGLGLVVVSVGVITTIAVVWTRRRARARTTDADVTG
jgi:hypothetical protein